MIQSKHCLHLGECYTYISKQITRAYQHGLQFVDAKIVRLGVCSFDVFVTFAFPDDEVE